MLRIHSRMQVDMPIIMLIGDVIAFNARLSPCLNIHVGKMKATNQFLKAVMFSSIGQYATVMATLKCV